MIILDGKKLAEKKQNELRDILVTQPEKNLTVILVGEDKASQTYVRNKEKACERVGIKTTTIRIPEGTLESDIIKTIKKLNEDDSVHNILLQLPLPKGYNEEVIVNSIAPHKDVDALTDVNRTMLFLNKSIIGKIPCTPFGIMMLLKEYEISVERKKVLIIGRSKLVGEPMLQIMNKMNATTMWANSYTPYETLKELCLQADIIISCAGRRNLITQDMVTPMTVLVDVGINVDEEGKLCGDAERSIECFAKTPVPGGIGPMTITALLWNCA
jgi:methylenetetrahydrofolate dehydrogenase (NADP+)/methenyltetrahydrofolate cyclohydrolase